ncbi:MAG: S8/S53 family peptidase [Thaumarchaeota archaeon]|nr:S8/S53 family peptidase [Nitrososphaerota archaeon]MBI3641554.1 S8/S53 family peptidase [Nitrososphaerota archaeon]
MGLLVRSILAFALCVILIFQIFSVTQFGITDSKNAFAQTSGSSPVSYTLYQNNNEGVSVEYPGDWTYSEKTQGQAMLTYFYPPNNSHTFLELSYDKTTDYTGTDQQILDELPQIIGILCSNASIAKNGFTCSNFQYTTAVGKYHGAPSYVMHGKMTETLSDGTTREQDTVQFLIITQNSDYGIFATCTKDECGNYNDELTHIVNSLNIYSLKTTNDPNAAQVSSYNIPSWIKNTAKWWSQGAVTDDDFVKGIQYLVQQGVIAVPTTQVSSQSSHAIPSWVKNSAKWWSEGQVGDSDFVKGIQYLVQNGIIVTQNNNDNNVSGILYGATFYTGPPPTPEMVTYTENGVTLSVLAIPREVLLYVTQDTNSDDINQAITGYGGTILSKIPAMGYYEVHVNDVSKFISDIRQKSFVMYAGPNFVLSPDQASPNFPNVLDFSKYKTGVDINAGAKDPNPSSKVVIAVIDNFNGCYVLKKGSHGCHVINEIQEKTPTLPIMAIQYDGTSDSDLTKDIASAIETARNNNQKIVINLSWGVKLRDDNGNVVPNEQEKYAKFIKSTLNMLNNQYVDDGNVVFVKSGGNDNIDVSKAIDQIKSDKNVGERFGKMYILSGQLDEDTQKPMEYVNKRGSNHGNGILYGDVTSDACPTGTSCTAPNIVAATAAIWNTKPELKSSDVRNGMINSAKNTGNYPVLSPQDALYSITKCLPSCPQLPYNPGKSSNSGTTSSGQQSTTNTQTTNGNQPATKYKTGEDYCQGTYGSKYHYDSSTNKCTSYGGYGSKESYCQGTYGSDYHYDSSQNLCVQSPGGTSGGNNGGQTTTITPAGDLSGHWSGSFSMKDTTSDGCTFSGSWEATLTQNGNDLSGSFSIVDSSSPDYPANDFCTLAPGTFSFSGGTVSSSSFQFDTSGVGEFHVKGYFTSDLIHGNFNECYDESCASGSFTGSRG